MEHTLLSLIQNRLSYCKDPTCWFYNFNLILKRRIDRFGLLFLIFILLSVPKPLVQAQDVLLGLTHRGGAQGGGTAFSIKGTGDDFTVQKSFAVSGFFPSENLCKGKDGNFYGMTYRGGTYDDHLYQGGTIFKMTPSGDITILRHLGTSDGAHPRGSLIQGSDGSFYGMTNYGDHGNIFRITATGTFTVLHQFDYYTDGLNPQASLVEGTDGNFYGMTSWGIYGDETGSIFRMAPDGTFTVLHHLDPVNDGANPWGSLVQGTDGSFYGMTSKGGKYNVGTIFKITANGAFTVLRNLSSANDGANPYGSLVQGSDGNLYGMTSLGGKFKYGTIFKITKNGAFSVLRNFDFYNDGSKPKGNLVLGSDGSFYGMTPYGGKYRCGTIFKITAQGAFTILHHPDRLGASQPDYRDRLYTSELDYSLVEGDNGTFYGMTYNGGTNVKGTIFKITSSGIYSVLTEFPEASKPYQATGGLIQASDGSYYGMSLFGGTNAAGMIYKICNDSFSTIKSFDSNYRSEMSGNGHLIQGNDGYFYGTTQSGGIGYGTIFKVLPNGGNYTVLHNLNYYIEGKYPSGGLVQGTDGNFYGMASDDTRNYGSIFKMAPDGTFTVLKKLDITTGIRPYGNLIQGSDGNYYGMTYGGGANYNGTIFKITSDGNLTVLHHLNSSTDGGNPIGNLVQGTDGNFYGMTNAGGSNYRGTIFKMKADGTLTVLHHLDGNKDGYNPTGYLVQGSDGSFYGTTSEGGAYNGGTIFKIALDGGSFTVLRHLNPAIDGSNPVGSLIIRKADPVAQAQSITTPAGTAKAITLTAMAPGAPLNFTVVSQPKNGTLSVSGSNYTYTPKAGFSGSDAFTFTATWGCQTSKVQTVSITVTESTPIATLAPVADAYVRIGSYANTNYGSNSLLVVKGTTAKDLARMSYLKFSLANISSVSSAKLRIYGSNVENTSSINLSTYGIANDSWTETGITWNNAPAASGAALSTVGVNSQPQYYELDVTSFVQAQVAGDKTASFLLKDPANLSRNLSFNSKENAANPPQLVLQTAPALSTIRLNSGGGEVSTSVGLFSAEAYFSSNSSITTSTAAIANTEDDALYQSTRKAAVSGGSFTYNVPVANGTYTLKLHFAELAFIASGQRKFNVSAEGTAWLSNYDIYAAAGGGKKAVVATKTVTVNDGMLNLNFISVIDKASIAAVEILPKTSGARLAVTSDVSESAVRLYPNPATDKLTVKLSHPAQQVTTLITDLTGVVHSRNKHQQVDATTLEIPVSSLLPSVYLMHLTTEQGKHTLKFVKQ